MPPATEAIAPALQSKLEELRAEHTRLGESLEDPSIAADHRKAREIAIRRAAIEPVVDAWGRYLGLTAEADALRAAAANPSDPDFAEMARHELPEVERRAAAVIARAKSLLVNADDQAVHSVMLEIRAGTGGDEATLWARDLLEVYQKYATKRGWKFDVLELSAEPAVGGIRSAVVNVRSSPMEPVAAATGAESGGGTAGAGGGGGNGGVWSDLNFEAGVHSVKRVPATEAQGRVHTSTATVAVLPEPEEVQVKIDWASDVTEDVTTAQGPGGQNVNKVATAVKLVHKPTGIEVRMQESKSQQQNREKARRLLMARVYELERRKAHEARAAARSAQIGSGERSEKIRTYRYKDGIVADERLPGEYQLRDILAGNLDELFKDLRERETERRLAEL